MPQRSFLTDRPCYITLANGAILEGRQWDAMPPLPTPQDTTTQAATYRAANKDKVVSVDVFYIRYATSARWSLPVQHVYAPGTHDCTKVMPVSHMTAYSERGTNGRPRRGDAEAGSYNWPRLGSVESEDCHFFAFIRPSDTATARPAVMHVHGGGWVENSALGPQSWGDILAADQKMGVILPTYRLSTFGHFVHPDITPPGVMCLAYEDQKTCLQWVNDHHAAMGLVGPTELVLTGTSAGGAAVQLFLEDDAAQSLFSAAWPDSGGGTGIYQTEDFATVRALKFEVAVKAMAPALTSDHPDYRTVQDAVTAMGLPWAMKNALSAQHVQALSDIGPIVTPASVQAAMAGSGPLVADMRESENVYPYRRGAYENTIAAAKAGKHRKPTVYSYAECEPLGLFGGNQFQIRDGLNAMPVWFFDNLSRRVGSADFAAYKAWWTATLTPFGKSDLKELSTSLLTEAVDPGGDAETRRVLYSHAVFGYGAWRCAKAQLDTGSAPAWLVLNNFSANDVYAGHSGLVQYMFGNVEWSVAKGVDFPAADPPGLYSQIHMDALYMSQIVRRKLAALCANGDPNGVYNPNGFDLFAGNPPADGGSLSATWTAVNAPLPYHHNILGKWFPGSTINNLNAVDAGGIQSQAYARSTYDDRMGSAFAAYLANLEP